MGKGLDLLSSEHMPHQIIMFCNWLKSGCQPGGVGGGIFGQNLTKADKGEKGGSFFNKFWLT